MTDRLRPKAVPVGEGVRKRTLYVPVVDRELWAWAQEHASRTGNSLSSVVATALARYREEEGEHGDSAT